MGDPLLLNKTSANLNSRMESEMKVVRQPVCAHKFPFFGICCGEKKWFSIPFLNDAPLLRRVAAGILPA
jgi:hypothetical protein